jgi:TIR domain
MTPSYRYDVFVSYRHAAPDLPWVRTRLAPRLTASGVRVCIDHECFVYGQPLVLEMERAVLESHYTVLILTPAYLLGAFAEFENLLATHLGLEQQHRRLIPVLREPCEVPLRIRYKLCLDMTDDSAFEADADRLCSELLSDD